MNARTSDNSEFHTDGAKPTDAPAHVNITGFDPKHADTLRIAKLLTDHARGKILTPGVGSVGIICPNSESHTEAHSASVCRATDAQRFGPGFSIKCDASCCKDKDSLTMLHMMQVDHWFDTKLLANSAYISFQTVVQPQPVKPRPALAVAPKPVTPEISAAKNDNAKSKSASSEKQAGRKDKSNSGPEYQRLIDDLHSDSKSQATSAAAKAILKADLDAWSHEQAYDAMQKKLGCTKSVLNSIFAEARRSLNAEKPEGKAEYDPQGRLIIYYKGERPDFHDAVGWLVGALKEKNRKDGHPTFCQADGTPMNFIVDTEKHRARFEEMTYKSLWSHCNNLVTFVKRGEKSDGVREDVSDRPVQQIFEQAMRYLPPAPEIIYAPMFTKKGKLIQKLGYNFDKNAGLNHFLCLGDLKVPEIPETVSEAQAKESWDWIDTELLGDFPYRDTDLGGNETKQSGKANAGASLLTPFMRDMIDGQTPMFYATKPQPGTGGTLLASLPIMLFDGGDIEYIPYTNSESEMGKLLVAEMLEGRRYLFFDDVEEINNRTIIRALTGEVVKAREIQTAHNVSTKNTFHWCGSGNNPETGEEMERRICWMRLNAKTSDLKKRKAFRHADFKKYVRQNRGLAIHHVLTMIAFWIQQRQPKFTERKLPSFEDWAAKVGGVLMSCGVKGFLDTAKPVALDMGASADIELQRVWLEKKGVVIFEKDVARNQFNAKELFDFADIENLAILKGRNDDEKRANFNKSLRKIVGRVFEFDKKEYEIKADNGDRGAVFWIAPLDVG